MSRLFTKPRKKSKTSTQSTDRVSRPESTEAIETSPFAESHPDALYILRLSHEGRGVARNAQGKTVFVEGALPGEWVTTRVYKTLSRYDEAVIDQLLKASPQRQNPPCVHYGRCGGCQLQHLQHSAQLDFKQKLVAEHLGFPLAEMEPALVASPLQYRRKARLGVKWRKDGRLLLGFREKNSALVAATPECQILVPELQALLPALYEFLPRLEGGKHLGHLEFIQGDHQVGLVVRLLRPLSRMSPADRKAWQVWAEAQELLLLMQEDGPAFSLDANVKDSLFSDRLGDLKLNFAANDFVQVNAEINRLMVAQALSWLELQGHEQLLDLFSGFGNFSLPLAQEASRVLGVEVLASQVERAGFNAQQNQLADKAAFITADLNQPLDQQPFAQQQWDVMVLDPPRSGADQLCREIKQIAPGKLLYVSCNPITLARDASSLKQQGYQLKRLGIMDMFPQTAHVESMALFVR